MVRQTLGNEMYNFPIPLDFSYHPQQLCVQQFATLSLDQRGPHDDVDNAGFILKGDKHHPSCSAGPLTTDHQTSGAHPGARFGLGDLGGSSTLATVQMVPQQGQRVTPEGKTEMGIIGDDILPFAGCTQ